MSSPRPAEVQVDVKPETLPRALAAHDLRSQDPEAARIPAPRIESDPAAHKLTVHLVLSAEHAPGTYHGVIVDCESQRLHGTISLRVFE
jgi:hypothetical protein